MLDPNGPLIPSNEWKQTPQPFERHDPRIGWAVVPPRHTANFVMGEDQTEVQIERKAEDVRQHCCGTIRVVK